MVVMYTWRRGSRLLFDKTRKAEMPLETLVATLEKKPPLRVPGTAVFLTSDPDERADRAAAQPQALQGAAREERHPDGRNRADAARRSRASACSIEPVGETFSRVVLRFGFMETPNVPKALAVARKLGWQFDIMSTSFFLSRRTLKPAAESGMPRWQDRLFIALARSANDATDYFQIPDRARGGGGHAGDGVTPGLDLTYDAPPNRSQRGADVGTVYRQRLEADLHAGRPRGCCRRPPRMHPLNAPPGTGRCHHRDRGRHCRRASDRRRLPGVCRG